MSACEKCWRDACRRAGLEGGSVTEHYYALLDERKDAPCSAAEQRRENPDADSAEILSAGEGKGVAAARKGFA